MFKVPECIVQTIVTMVVLCFFTLLFLALYGCVLFLTFLGRAVYG